jgi:hypothetical protein
VLVISHEVFNARSGTVTLSLLWQDQFDLAGRSDEPLAIAARDGRVSTK